MVFFSLLHSYKIMICQDNLQAWGEPATGMGICRRKAKQILKTYSCYHDRLMVDKYKGEFSHLIIP